MGTSKTKTTKTKTTKINYLRDRYPAPLMPPRWLMKLRMALPEGLDRHRGRIRLPIGEVEVACFCRKNRRGFELVALAIRPTTGRGRPWMCPLDEIADGVTFGEMMDEALSKYLASRKAA